MGCGWFKVDIEFARMGRVQSSRFDDTGYTIHDIAGFRVERPG